MAPVVFEVKIKTCARAPHKRRKTKLNCDFLKVVGDFKGFQFVHIKRKSYKNLHCEQQHGFITWLYLINVSISINILSN